MSGEPTPVSTVLVSFFWSISDDLALGLRSPVRNCIRPSFRSCGGRRADFRGRHAAIVNATAIAMFLGFVAVSLAITRWAARRGTSTAKDFYAAGGGLKGFQNGLAIAGDYTSAATFLGVTALVYTSGYDGMIYAIGFLVG